MNIKLPKIVEIEAKIPPSSSSMIRHFISRIINSEEIGENQGLLPSCPLHNNPALDPIPPLQPNIRITIVAFH